MKQKLFTFFFALVASISAIYAQSGTCGSNLTWMLNAETGVLTISGTGAMDDYNYGRVGTVVSPWNDFTSVIKTVIINDGVTSIGMMAFAECSSLTSVTIPNSVTSIGGSAFDFCSSLTSITIPESVTSIGESAFGLCESLTSITIPNSVTSIEMWTFLACSSLTSVTIGNSVEDIGYQAFASCSSLSSITIPNSVTSIGDWAFSDCSSLTSPVYNAHCFAYMPTSYSGAYTIPEGIEQIAGGAFSDCSSLTSVTIPNSVTSIGKYAFEGCSSLTSITIPNSVTSIGNSAFYDCSSLTSVTIPNSVTSIGDHAFSGCSSLISITIPNSVTSIGKYAFEGCSSLTSMTIPESVTSIGYRAFKGCSSLTSVTLNSNTIVNKTYNYNSTDNLSNIFNTQITEFIIGNNVKGVGDYAFYGCSSLTSVTIGESVTSIGYSAFNGCSKLTSITCEAETPATVGQYAFDGVSKSVPVYVPCGCVKAYKAASGWKDFTNIQEPLAEYSIEVYVNDTIMGTAKVDYNTFCEGAQISASPNIGYHFVQWSDGNTENPRTLELTQDTTLTAEFAINQYTITTVSSDTQRGTTKGDTTVNYLEYITISATASYGYHFTQWNDANVENPRQVQVTGDATYIATFDKNTYAISLSCNEEQGSVEGVTSAEYLDTVTISATPNIGYHFVQWSDGITDNPRTLELTQDTILIAEFAQSFSGQCGDNLYWSYDETAKTVSITGSGKMYDYTADTQPWFLFKEQIVEVTTNNTVTSIGTSAFEGCVRLAKISLGTGLEEIAANAFAGCTRLYDIYTYATYPPFAEESSFANYNVYVYVPCEYQRDYTLDIVWGKFKFIECIDSEDATTDGNVTVAPGYNDVTITWPTAENADTYSLVINKDNQPFCTLTFNQEGQLLNIAFAPSRDGNNRPAQYAEQAVNGYRFTVTGLTEATQYAYNITTKDAANKTIATYSGEFTTMGGTTTAVEDILQNTTNVQKLLRNGQLIIVRDGVEYNAMGQEM